MGNICIYCDIYRREEILLRHHNRIHHLHHLSDVGFMHQAIIGENSFQGVFAENFGEGSIRIPRVSFRIAEKQVLLVRSRIYRIKNLDLQTQFESEFQMQKKSFPFASVFVAVSIYFLRK